MSILGLGENDAKALLMVEFGPTYFTQKAITDIHSAGGQFKSDLHAAKGNMTEKDYAYAKPDAPIERVASAEVDTWAKAVAAKMLEQVSSRGEVQSG